ncbi:hypothetical protein DLJ47_30425 [Micromonospora sp. S4605]|uniref:DUF4194 domain-containing protein n=1 Tax=Micromonospora sp. S4605 TaxID=1420897 RepID=UPI000D6F080A|nr:DUF4194 domain-containing protein [Micromonospora sp. S4605]PWU47501.1 hypothetical protein DLJ47_30425 [Micromonospora sp. S4605]
MSVDDIDPASGPEPFATAGWDDPERELTSSVALFEGDEGGLELPQRRALVALIKQRFITAQSHPKEWKALTANPRLIRSRLNDLFLDLHLDTDREVAFKRQVVPEGGGRFPTLLHDTAWAREETILLVYLRTRSRSEEVAGTSRTFIDRQDMLEHIVTFRPAQATDQAGDARRAAKAIESLNRAGLLIGPSTADRFEVSPAIDVVLPLERLQDLLRWLKAHNAAGAAADGVTGPSGDAGDEMSDEEAR